MRDRGRPLRAEAPSRPIRVKISPAERALAQEAAKINHQNLSEFTRDAILTAASDCLEGCAMGRHRVVILPSLK
jgi:uncharacterized protein (DUF1778 family)